MREVEESHGGLSSQLPRKLSSSYENRARATDMVALDPGAVASVRLTTGAIVDITVDNGFDFGTEFDNQQGANTMWLYSLQPLRVLGEAIRSDNNEVQDVFLAGWNSAVEHLVSPAGRETAGRVASADHAAATRLRACLEAGELIRDGPLRGSVRQIADSTLEWLLSEEHYRPNNHGLMSSIALLHWYIAMRDLEPSAHVRDVAVTRILDLARNAFDRDGLCNENTIGYHNFNLFCYDEVRRMHEIEKFDETIENQLLPIIEQADLALSHCMLQDNTVPTIGDSGRYPIRHRKSLDRSAGFPESGFGVVKDERLYLSAICGSRSEIHKHADDSSITVSYDCQPLVIDSGSYLYDANDPYRKAMASALGHSGIVPAILDGLTRSELLRTYPAYWARTDSRPSVDDGWRRMDMTYGVADLLDVSRTMAVDESSRWVAVTDRVTFSSDTVDTRARQRWLLGPQLGARRLGHGRWWFPASEGMGLNLISWGCTEEELYRGENTGLHRGWYSEQYGKKVPVFGMNLTASGTYQVIRTLLHVADNPLVDLTDIPPRVLRRILS